MTTSDPVCNALIASIEGLGFEVWTGRTSEEVQDTAYVYFTAKASRRGVLEVVQGPDLRLVLTELAVKCGVELEDG